MKRWLPDYRSLRACLGLWLVVLPVVSALHFTLGRHGYSAALGGVVHVHASARAEPGPRPKVAAPRATALSTDLPSCGAELCPVGNAPVTPAPRIELLLAGLVAFGEARLLSERATRASE